MAGKPENYQSNRGDQMSFYRPNERRRREAAKAVIGNPTSPYDAKERAFRTLDRLAATAKKRLKPPPPCAADFTPTQWQQRVIDQFIEAGDMGEAQLWFQVYKAESEAKASKTPPANLSGTPAPETGSRSYSGV
jgi:hypothetical protein